MSEKSPFRRNWIWASGRWKNRTRPLAQNEYFVVGVVALHEETEDAEKERYYGDSNWLYGTPWRVYKPVQAIIQNTNFI